MMIEDQQHREYSIRAVGKMYPLRDRGAASNCCNPDTRNDMVDGVESMIRKTEREIAEHLAQKYGLVSQPVEKAA
jgi:hypothetical protein